MNTSETIPVEGVLAYRVRRRGVVVEDVCEQNLVMNLPRNYLKQLLAGEQAVWPAGWAVSHIAFDAVADAPDGTEAAADLVEPFTKAVGGHIYPDGTVGEVRFLWTLTNAEANGSTIRRFALLLADGSLFSLKSRAGAIEKDEDVDLEGSWTLKF